MENSASASCSFELWDFFVLNGMLSFSKKRKVFGFLLQIVEEFQRFFKMSVFTAGKLSFLSNLQMKLV